MNIQQAIDLAVAEDRAVIFECSDDNDSLKASISDLKGCAAMKPTADSTTVVITPPSQCIDRLCQGKMVRLPFCFRGPGSIDFV